MGNIMRRLLSILVLLGLSPYFSLASVPVGSEAFLEAAADSGGLVSPRAAMTRFPLRMAEQVGIQGSALAVLTPLHCSGRPFWDDLIHTLSACAVKIPEVHVVFLFRTDENPDQIAQSIALLNACLGKYQLPNVLIYQNKCNFGCGITRRLLLGDLHNLMFGDSSLMAAAHENKLYYTFMDNDDAVHSCLYRVMLQAAVRTKVDIVNGEYLNQQFGILTVDRIQHFEEDVSIAGMSYVWQMPDKGGDFYDGLAYDQDGRRVFNNASNSVGYLPIVFKYRKEAVEKMLLIERSLVMRRFLGCSDVYNPIGDDNGLGIVFRPILSCIGDTMHDFIGHSSGCKTIALVLESDTPAMYYYRQHSKSQLHDLDKEFSVNWIVDNISEFLADCQNQEYIRFLLSFGADNIASHLEKVKGLLNEAQLVERYEARLAEYREAQLAGETQYDESQLAEYRDRLDRMAQQIRDEKARLEAKLEEARSAATTPWQLGLSWTEE
ncbi:MAG: hypothetical protein LBJ03_01375 [Holosporales bacterium]|jgi:hypothetical protein|nr:hypothetical protein [Holosporales bacterium]